MMKKKQLSPREIERQKSIFEDWQTKNPSKTFKDYYAESQAAKLLRGKPHQTLGGKLYQDDFASSGQGMFKRLLKWGLKPDDVCVDYGCGTLRIGLHVINYLKPAGYWGLDISEYFLEEGRKLIGEELLAEKRPNLRVISSASVAEAAVSNPTILFSSGVIFHVHPNELAEYVGNIMTLTEPKGQAFIGGKWSAGETVQYSGQSWAHSLVQIEQLVRERGGRLDVLHEGDFERAAPGSATKIGIFRFSRA